MPNLQHCEPEGKAKFHWAAQPLNSTLITDFQGNRFNATGGQSTTTEQMEQHRNHTKKGKKRTAANKATYKRNKHWIRYTFRWDLRVRLKTYVTSFTVNCNLRSQPPEPVIYNHNLVSVCYQYVKNALQYSVSCYSTGDLWSQQSDAVDAWLMSENNPHNHLDISQTFTATEIKCIQCMLIYNQVCDTYPRLAGDRHNVGVGLQNSLAHSLHTACMINAPF